MSWRVKHLYAVLVVAFLIYSGIGLLFYSPLLTFKWIPALLSLYLLAYLLLPFLRKFTSAEFENEPLERIAKILKDNTKCSYDFDDIDNAYVRLTNDWIFRNCPSNKYYDRIKDTIANYYFNFFTAISLGIVAVFALIALLTNLGSFLTSKTFLLTSVVQIFNLPAKPITAFGINGLVLIPSLLFGWRFFSLSKDHEERAKNQYMLLISKSEEQIKELAEMLKDDPYLQKIANSKINIP